MKPIFVIAILALCFQKNAHAQLEFRDPILVENQLSPYQLTTNDFDGNGFKDIAYTTQDDGKLKVLYNQGSYNFIELSLSISTGKSYDFPLTSGDLNKDGLADIVVFDPVNQNQVTVLLSAGTSFIMKRFSLEASNIYTSQISVFDFNNDGNLDIIVPINGSPLIIFLGDGKGDFTKLISQDILDGGLQIIFSDLNKDGNFDIAIATLDKIETYINNQIGYIKKTINRNGFALKMISTDTDGDGYPDLLLSWLRTPDQPYLLILKNDGNGEFTNEQIVSNAIPYRGLVHLDYNNDAREDLVVGAFSSNFSLQILQNTGNNIFVDQSPNNSLSNSIFDLALSDLDNDGNQEIIEISVIGTLNIYKKKTTQYELDYRRILGAKPNFGKAVDLNKDGYIDIVGSGIYSASVAILYGNGDFTFNSPSYIKAKGPVYSIETGDYNSDGYEDLLYSSIESAYPQADEIVLVLSDALGNLTNQVVIDNTGTRVLVSGDFNQDGKLDFANDSKVFLGDGNGNFTFKILAPPPLYFFSLTTGHFNSDTFLDLAFNDWTDTYIALNDGTGNFPSFNKINSTRTFAKNKSFDYNHDNLTDLISLSRDNLSATILINRGDGQFDELIIQPTSGNLFGFVDAVDLDKDDDFDIITGYGENNLLGLAIFTQISPGQFNLSHKIDFKTSPPEHLIGADFNNDHRTDIFAFKTNGDPFVLVPNDAVTEPIISPSQLQVTMRSEKSASISFSKGDGTGRLIIIREGLAVSTNPSDGIFYPANNKLGVGFEIAPSQFVLMRDDKTTLDITGLKENTEYFISLFEYSNNFKNTTINYLNNQSASISFRTKINQSIVANSIADKKIGDSDFDVIVSSTSNLPVNIQVISGQVHLTNKTLSLLSAGPVKLLFTQDGNDDFVAAPNIEITFCINPLIPTISTSSTGLGQYTLTSSSDINNNWLRNNTLIPEAISKTYQPTQDGIYSVKVDYSGCSNTSLPTVNLITGIEKMYESISLYPNPASDKLFIEWPKQNPKIDQITILDSQGKQKTVDYAHNDDGIILNLQDLTSGLFIVRLQTQNGTVNKKIIKN